MTVKVIIHNTHVVPQKIRKQTLQYKCQRSFICVRLYRLFMFFFPGLHRRLRAKAGRGQLQFYLLVPLLRKEATLINPQLNLVEEQLLSRCRRKTYKFLHEKTTELWDKLEGGTIITSDFLKELDTYMHRHEFSKHSVCHKRSCFF